MKYILMWRRLPLIALMIVVGVLHGGLVMGAQADTDDEHAYLNPDLPVEERVADLLARMSLNANLPTEEAIIAGIQGASAEAQVVTVLTDTGYAVEVAVPLNNAVWSIDPTASEPIGFQVHLNSASASSRDTKLIWSIWDTADRSYLDPSVFGELYFFPLADAPDDQDE